MGKIAFDPKEVLERQLRFGRGEVLPLTFSYDGGNNTGVIAPTGAAFGSFTADKDYVIRRVAMSATCYDVTTPLIGSVLLAFSDLTGLGTVPSNALFRGGVIGSMAYRLENSMILPFGDPDENVPLEKNRTIYAHLRNSSATGRSQCLITVQLVAVGSQ